MRSGCDEKVEMLEGEVSKYKGMLEKILDAEKFVARVITGPEKNGEKLFFRVQLGTTEKIVTYTPTPLFDIGESPEITANDEVIVAGDSIISIVPKTLIEQKEKISLQKLVDWDQIGGMKSQIEQIRESIEGPMLNQELARQMGVEPIKGIMLYGPPGCGKTLIAKAVAKTILASKEVEADAFVYMKGAEVLSPFVGVAEQTIRVAFSDSRKYSARTGKRAVIFIDEAEAILPRRGSRNSSDVDSTIVPSFLAEMDGFDDHSPIILLATNKPGSIDEAVIREGRIDLKIEIARPTQEDVEEMFEIHSRKIKLADEIALIANLGARLMFQPETKARVSGAMVETIMKLAAGKALSRRLKCTNCPEKEFGVNVFDIEETYDSIKQKVA